MKPTTKQARAIINSVINNNNAYHIGTWTDKKYYDSYSEDRYVAYRISSLFDKKTNYDAAMLLNKVWPGCANANVRGYVRVKCTIA